MNARLGWNWEILNKRRKNPKSITKTTKLDRSAAQPFGDENCQMPFGCWAPCFDGTTPGSERREKGGEEEEVSSGLTGLNTQWKDTVDFVCRVKLSKNKWEIEPQESAGIWDHVPLSLVVINNCVFRSICGASEGTSPSFPRHMSLPPLPLHWFPREETEGKTWTQLLFAHRLQDQALRFLSSKVKGTLTSSPTPSLNVSRNASWEFLFKIQRPKEVLTKHVCRP